MPHLGMLTCSELHRIVKADDTLRTGEGVIRPSRIRRSERC